MSYNGWKNYETWLVNLWLDNDGTSEYLRERVREEYETREDFDAHQFGKVISEYVEEVYLEPAGNEGMLADLVNAALSEVDWQEIASHYEEDLPESEEEEA